jgi:hypothetical protein
MSKTQDDEEARKAEALRKAVEVIMTQPTCSVLEAATARGIKSARGAYAALHRGEFETIKNGRQTRVICAAERRRLQLEVA